MSSRLLPVSVIKLVKLLNLLSSNHAGERDAAGLAAHRLVRSHGLTWEQVLSPAPAAEPWAPEPVAWLDTVHECLARPEALTAWELRFLNDIRWCPALSVKQQRCLDKIAYRVWGGRSR